MNKYRVCALLLVFPLTGVAASGPSVLFSGATVTREGSRSIVSGQASAIFASPDDMKVAASEIIYVPERNALECSGDVRVTAAGRTITGAKLTVELGAVGKKVYFLSPTGIATQNVTPRPK